MKKKITACLFLLFASLILTSCSVNNTVTPTNSPVITQLPIVTSTSVPTPTNSPMVSGSPAVNNKISDAAAKAYLDNMRSILEILDKLEIEYPGDTYKNYYENCFSGALYDLNVDGRDELIITYPVEDKDKSFSTYYYKIYSFESNNSVLVKSGTLFVDAGAPRGGLSIVNYNGDKYICVWNYNSEAGKQTQIIYNCELFNFVDRFLLKHSFKFVYYIDKNGPIPDKSILIRDSETIPFDEFLLIKKDFDNPIKELSTVGKGLTNYRLRQLYEDLKNK